jgi:SAM-dependent methyltransferase
VLPLTELVKLLARPAPFSGHSVPFWDDPYIARRLLAAHLDPHTDAASRRPERIDAEIAWLRAPLGLRPGQRVLDLGCGPGLYAVRLAEHDLLVTGVDLSPSSLRYARRAARERGLRITFRRQNYLTLTDERRYDAALLIYYDFGVLSDEQRDDLLSRVHRALRPGGAFVFDVRSGTRPTPAPTWNLGRTGFWRAGPYLELTEWFEYPEIPATLRQTLILQDRRPARVFRFWDRSYTPRTLVPVLEQHGFVVDQVWGDLAGSPYADNGSALAILARAPA